MSNLADDPYIFVVPYAPVRRAIAFVMVAVFSPFELFVGILAGKNPASPVGWILLTLFTAMMAGFLWLAFPPSRVLAHLDFRHNGIRFTPTRFDRWMGSSTIEAAIPPDCRDILFRYRYANYKLFIRTTDGRERDTGIALLTELRESDERELTSGIRTVTGLPFRMTALRPLADGSTVEVPWEPRSARAKWSTIGKMIFGAVPLGGGAIVGYLTANYVIIGLAGLALWLAETLGMAAYAGFGSAKKRFPWLYWMSTIVTFGAGYAAIAVFVSFLLHPR